MSDATPSRPERSGGNGGQGRGGSRSRGRRSRSGGTRGGAAPARATGNGAQSSGPRGSAQRQRGPSGTGRAPRPGIEAGPPATVPRTGGGQRAPDRGPSARHGRAHGTTLSAHDEADRENHERMRSNRHRVQVLCTLAAAFPALVLGLVLGFAAGPVVGAVVAVVVAVAVAVLLVRRAVSVALAMIGGRPLGEEEQPALSNLVSGLCATLGVRRPHLWLVDDPVANSCALAGRGGRSVLVVTSGLLDGMDLIEMEGVVAHELAHVKRHDATVSAVAIATAGIVARVTGHDQLVHRAVGQGREYGADRVAVLAVRYPPGLHDALCSMTTANGTAAASAGRPATPSARAGSVFRGPRWAATRWVWIDPMVGEHVRTPVGEVDATDVRAAALAEW